MLRDGFYNVERTTEQTATILYTATSHTISGLGQMTTRFNSITEWDIPTEEALVLKKVMVSSGLKKKSLKVWTGSIERQCPRMQGEVVLNISVENGLKMKATAVVTWEKQQ